MNNLIFTFVEINIYLAAFAGIYFFFLKNLPNHRLNRFVILGSVAASFALPFMALPGSEVLRATAWLPEVVVGGNPMNISSGNGINYLIIPLALYAVGVSYHLLRFALNLRAIRKMRQTLSLDRLENGVKIYTGPSIESTTSFFDSIFSANEASSVEEQELIIAHELVHAREKHSADVVFISVVKALCWFNPAIYYLEKALKTTNEFRADEVVSRSITDKSAYGELLISSAFGVKPILLANQFSNSNLLKKRITMLYKNNAKNASFSSYFLLATVGILAVFVQSCTKENPNEVVVEEQVIKIDEQAPISQYDEESGVYRVVEEMPQFKGGKDALMNYLANHIVYPEECKDLEMEGLVYVAFTIGENGAVSDIEVIRSPDSRMSAAAVEAVSKMPDWEPGKHKGERVKVRYNLPVKFKLS